MLECEHCGNEQTKQVQAASKKLYNWLLKPLEAELKNNQVKNIVFALDRVTRYIPISALFDGKHYLIENYTIHTILSASVTDVEDKLPANIQDTSILAMGMTQGASVPVPWMSQPDKFAGLSNVRQEIDAIVKNNTNNQGIYPGQKFPDAAFDFHRLQDNLTGKKILHLATHGRFVPKFKDASYLLLGIRKPLTIPQIQALTGLSNIHLVVLSACQTALADRQQDGIEIASLAYYFLNGGAKAVIASLWQVNDTSTKDLMQHFYTYLAQNPQLTKAEALRLAQLSLLHGKQVAIDDIKRGAINLEPVPGKLSQQTSTGANFAHPYYWAPFILIGNGM
ncbi:CHAT domain-containing protein [Aetokthonos hydrillicola Thurmond2011]|uniref:CHAT domain-containing protein n=1 Tax=Aetokthonos hydrillicola Thurmond2011 TaxID=2712845 RepID=A0AAP5I9M7_9CYAN|nr:CHAT domain-containing protein [Aetokthonos hydrillicola]MBO3463717.1 CHAT domain-containing protein [Aetokthonos hydrillicola CCALA 1050]MBW4587009.1 CHAT domain-containing protein [Aetokthonos hydrillicola CCALA 1050]MDR9897517.1 CHAT domain-containing protein [Aetokthonos hydrillicola Thurmond2011]